MRACENADEVNKFLQASDGDNSVKYTRRSGLHDVESRMGRQLVHCIVGSVVYTYYLIWL